MHKIKKFSIVAGGLAIIAVGLALAAGRGKQAKGVVKPKPAAPSQAGRMSAQEQRDLQRALAESRHSTPGKGKEPAKGKENDELARALAASAQEEKERTDRLIAVLEAEVAALQHEVDLLEAEFGIERKSAEAKQAGAFWVSKVRAEQVTVVQQKGTECGYWVAVDAVILFNALNHNLLTFAKQQLNNPSWMRAELKKVQEMLAKVQGLKLCKATLDEGDIADIMRNYGSISEESYSMFATLLPTDPAKLPSLQRPIIDVIKSLKMIKDFRHIFFLRHGASSGMLGHWIVVVAENNGKEIVCYVIDSLKSSSHDSMWKSLVTLIQNVKQTDKV